MSLFVRLRFWEPTRFPEVICPRYDRDCTLLDLSKYLPFKFYYVQRLPPQEVPKISMEIDPDTHTVLGNILFVVGALKHSFCVSSIFHIWYLKG